MTYEAVRAAYNRGEQVPRCYLSQNGRLLGKHTWPNGNPYMTTPIRQDTPYYYPEEEHDLRENWVEPRVTDGFSKLSAEVMGMRNKLNNHLDYKDERL